MNKQKFVTDNIELINESNFNHEKLVEVFGNKTELDNFLFEKINKEFPIKKNLIFNRWKKLNFDKSKIKDLSNEFYFKESHLRKKLLKVVGDNLANELNVGNYSDIIEKFITEIEQKNKELGFSAIKTDFKKVFTNNLFFSLQRGFPVNIENINSGVMVANAGDSHQFLFLARAILAGFNCSNVDVRSSRYDAIVDYKDQLFKVQIKGIQSDTSRISFKDRDRGGQGIDHTHTRNIGKKITSKDCDIYAAVDKNTGICYLIPMSWIDKLNVDNISIKEIQRYKENWKVFDEIK